MPKFGSAVHFCSGAIRQLLLVVILGRRDHVHRRVLLCHQKVSHAKIHGTPVGDEAIGLSRKQMNDLMLMQTFISEEVHVKTQRH